MGLFDRLKADDLKAVARQAFDRVSLEGKSLAAFIPFLLSFDSAGGSKKYTCVAATNEEAQDMAYEMVRERFTREPASVAKYAMVFVGHFDPEKDKRRPLVAECGDASRDHAVLYGTTYQEDNDALLKKISGVFKIRETANALHQRKSFAVRTVRERGAYISTYMARIPLLLTYLTAIELSDFDGNMPSEAWTFYRRLLEEWSNRQISIGYLMAAFSIQAITENRVDQLMPREGITAQTLKSALHIGNQILIEGVKTGRIALEDLQLTLKELYAYVGELAACISDGKRTENFQALLDYLKEMSSDPLVQTTFSSG
jgi:hypothetical protein